jgi:hypothetical protein
VVLGIQKDRGADGPVNRRAGQAEILLRTKRLVDFRSRSSASQIVPRSVVPSLYGFSLRYFLLTICEPTG